MRVLTGEICLTQRGISATAWSGIRWLPRKNRGDDQEWSKDIFWICRLKEIARWLPISYAFWRCRLASGLGEIYDLFAEFIQQTYTDDVWVPSGSGPEHVLDDPPFGTLQFTSDGVESVLQDLDIKKGSGPDGIPPIILKNCANQYHFFLTGLLQRAFFPTGGRIHTLLGYSRNVGVTTLKTIVAWQYYLQFRNVLNCWFIKECSTTWRI
jgi:hypothetical protein